MTEHEIMQSISSLPVKIYKRIGALPKKAGFLLVLKFRVFLEDKPGSLADFASYIAGSNGNISFFHYDRSLHSNRVVVEVQISSMDDLLRIADSLRKRPSLLEETRIVKDDVQITSLGNILEIKVRLENKPGTLAAFANLLKGHHANVLYMLYDEDIDTESADIAMATKDIEEVDSLLDAVNKAGYYYRVLYRGADEKEAEHIIGLKLVEKFFLKLKKLLAHEDFNELRSIVDSSQDMQADLVQFYEEAGKYLESGDVFEKILALASQSRSRIGKRFSAVEMPPVQINDNVRLYSFRLPTSENIYLFHHDQEITMIDAGYGIYYQDIKKMMREKSLEPSQVSRIFLTHPDADHAGTAEYFADEFGTKVFLHPGCKGVIRNRNRAYGLTGRLANLNKYYTRLINTFTGSRFHKNITYLVLTDHGRIGEFNIVNIFHIGNLKFEALESHGGHIPGHVFFLNREHGLLFTSDFLINVQSLSSEERNILGVYRYLLTNPNSDNQIYNHETEALKEVIRKLNETLKLKNRQVTIFPGHGEYYRADMTGNAKA
jgi:glyoxylase-like metal-dependent hydrolase (beta-lactamase superfamily II)/uncharacterized protein with ACT and thioredoxin-like domain